MTHQSTENDDWRKYRTKHFWEEFARLLLIEFIDHKFSDLVVKDCPDLQNEIWGIEVLF